MSLSLGLGLALTRNKGVRRPVILLDTDMASDCGDAGALAVLLRLVQLGEASLAGVVTDSSNIYSAPCCEALLKYAGFYNVPIGAYQGSSRTNSSTYAQTVAAEFGQEAKNRGAYPAALPTLRTVLASAAPHSITYLNLGSLGNLSELLQSPGDGISALTGAQLVAEKVSRIVLMGGDYPSSSTPEFNFADAKTDAAYVFANTPVDVYAIGYTSGGTIASGPPAAADPATNPFRRAYNLDGYPTTRTGWDHAPVLFAVRGARSGFSVVSGRGDNVVNTTTGNNTWTANPSGKCFYFERTGLVATINAELDALTAAVAAAPIVYTYFNNADKSSANLALSNNSRTVTHIGANADLEVRGAHPIVGAQKKYFEYHVGAVTGTTNLMTLGLANITHLLSDWIGHAGDSIGNNQTGTYFGGGASGAAPGTWDDGGVIRVAYDRGNQKAWFSINGGNWNGNGTADPATNTNGLNCGGMNDCYPIAMLSRAGDNVTLCSDPATWAYSAPSGFYPIRA